MISLADKWKNTVQFYIYILSSILGMVLLYWFMYISLPSTLPSNTTDWIISLAPFIILIYSLETKILAYRRNVNYFILASALSYGATKIHKKYKIFFKRKDYSNLLTGEKITFDDFEEIIALRETIFSHIQEEDNNTTN